MRRWLCKHCSVRNEAAAKKCSSCQIRPDTKRTSLKARADSKARDLVKLRDKRCRRCGSAGPLEWAHIHRRAKHSVRWLLENAFSLCRECHHFFTEHPFAFARFVVEQLGQEKTDELERAANTSWDRDYPAVFARLAESERVLHGNQR